MSGDAPDRSTAARLAQASERLNILAHELRIATAEGPGADHPLLSSLSARLGGQALDLAELVFAVAEDVVSASGDVRAERSAAALGRVSRVVEPVFELASELAAHLVICVEEAAGAGASLTSARLARLDEPITRLLADEEALVTGAGVATAPGALADRELWLQWWTRGSQGPVPLHPQLDRTAEGFYDYPSAVWFREAARDHAPHLAPPHFDEGGTGTWMVTATVPVVVRGRLVGLACAELTLERLGTLVGPALRALASPTALVSPEGTVVASHHPDLHPGQTVPYDDWDAPHATFAELRPGVTLARSPALAWTLLTDWRSDPR